MQKFFASFFQKRSAFFLFLLLARCAAPPVTGGLTLVRFSEIPGWGADNMAQALPALRAGCRRLETLPADTALGGAGVAAAYGGLAGQWVAACRSATVLVPGDDAGIRAYFETWYSAYRVKGSALFTGYYEPEVRGSLVPGGVYQTPLLARPTDLRAGVPYFSRAEIEAGRAGEQARALLWLADPVDLFFLQVQGAGRVRLPDGSLVRLAYDGKNGRAYTPIGRVLVERGALVAGSVTMQSIRGWLAANKGEAGAVMDRNEDYVFFRVLNDADVNLGPPGALGVALTAGRSAAVDRLEVPLGTPVFVDTTDPLGGAAFRRLVMAQDVGSDIVGAGRTDIFLGAGAQAEQRAGAMHQAGREYVLLPRSSALRP